MPQLRATNIQETLTTGVVGSLSVSGNGPNSAEIVLGLNLPDGTSAAFGVFAYPSTEPSVFTSFATMLTAAYASKDLIDIVSIPNPGGVPQITCITFQAHNGRSLEG